MQGILDRDVEQLIPVPLTKQPEREREMLENEEFYKAAYYFCEKSSMTRD
jgi:hypothetical protein